MRYGKFYQIRRFDFLNIAPYLNHSRLPRYNAYYFNLHNAETKQNITQEKAKKTKKPKQIHKDIHEESEIAWFEDTFIDQKHNLKKDVHEKIRRYTDRLHSLLRIGFAHNKKDA